MGLRVSKSTNLQPVLEREGWQSVKRGSPQGACGPAGSSATRGANRAWRGRGRSMHEDPIRQIGSFEAGSMFTRVTARTRRRKIVGIIGGKVGLPGCRGPNECQSGYLPCSLSGRQQHRSKYQFAIRMLLRAFGRQPCRKINELPECCQIPNPRVKGLSLTTPAIVSSWFSQTTISPGCLSVRRSVRVLRSLAGLSENFLHQITGDIRQAEIPALEPIGRR